MNILTYLLTYLHASIQSSQTTEITLTSHWVFQV